jgi:hypothetical protein
MTTDRDTTGPTRLAISRNCLNFSGILLEADSIFTFVLLPLIDVLAHARGSARRDT